MTLQSLMNDTILIVKLDDRRIGPHQAAVCGDLITIMEDAIDIEEGDHVARSIPSGKEELYLVLSIEYSHSLGPIPASYRLKVKKTSSLLGGHTSMKSTTININNSTGIQVGDYNTQHIQAIFNELVEKIDHSTASPAEKAEAKSRLAAFLEHPLITSLLGSAASAVLSTVCGG